MRVCLLILTLFWSCFVFGQDEVRSYCDGSIIDSPESDLTSFTNNFSFNYFFPPELMKEKGIKSIIIKNTDDDKIPTIHIAKDDFSKYILNDEGQLSESYELHYKSYYKWKNNKISYVKNVYHYSDEIDTTEHYYDFSNNDSKMIYTKTDNRNWDFDDNYKTIYDYENNQLVAETHYDNDEIYISKKFKFNKSENYALMIVNGDFANYVDTFFFNDLKQEIKRTHWEFEHEDIYNTTGFHLYNENGRLKSINFIHTERNMVYESHEAQEGKEVTTIIMEIKVIFTYSSDDLLEKIFIQTNNETCEKTVYYYTE